MELLRCLDEIIKDKEKVEVIKEKYREGKYRCVLTLIMKYREERLALAREANREVECIDYIIRKIEGLI